MELVDQLEDIISTLKGAQTLALSQSARYGALELSQAAFEHLAQLLKEEYAKERAKLAS